MTDAAPETPGSAPGQPPDPLPERAADLAVELTETGEPRTPLARRLAEPVGAAALAGARATGHTLRAAQRRVRLSRHWLTAQVIAMAPRLKIRDQATLRAQFPGLDDDALAGALIEGAAKASAAVGGAVGAWAAVPTTLPAFPAEVLTETVALVGIEIKLVAELHEAYGMPARGSKVDRATAYIASWAHRRGVFMVPGGLALAAGSPLARQLQRRLAARAGRSAFSLSPLFTGAVAGAFLNRRETRRLGYEVQADLRSRRGRVP